MSDWTSAEPLDAAQGPAVCSGDSPTLSSQLLLHCFVFCFDQHIQGVLYCTIEKEGGGGAEASCPLQRVSNVLDWLTPNVTGAKRFTSNGQKN